MTEASNAPSAQVEREQTDESLRVERERTDLVLGDTTGVDHLADEVINTARERADAVLVAARAKTDQQTGRAQARVTDKVALARSKEDREVRDERADADDTVRAERAEHAVLLTKERDATDEDLIIERVRADSALATRDAFLAIVSHDLRNMLTSVMAFADLITRDAADESRATRIIPHAQAIRRAGARMNRLVGDLVDVATIDSRVLSVNPDRGDPAVIAAEAVETFQAQAAAAHLTLTCEIVPPLPLVAFDSARILQVLTNLLSNAIKFTSAKGRIGVRLVQVGEEVQVAVRDTGSGIPETKLEAIFSRFVQVNTAFGGVGLGLYISKAIVEGHGGRMWVESEVGKGSTFYFTLPVDSAAKPSVQDDVDGTLV